MFNAATFNSVTFNSASAKVQKSAGDIGAAVETLEKPFFDIFDVGTVLDLAAQSQGSVVTAATSSDDGSTRTPAAAGVLLALNTGAAVLIYQSGTEDTGGLLMRLSEDRGVTWGNDIQISDKTGVYPSAVVQRDTNDIHLVYSIDDSNPTKQADSSVYYRRLIYTGSTIPSFNIGTELIIMVGDASTAYTRASISIDSGNVPFCAALKNTADGNSIAVAIGAVAGNLAGAKIDSSVVGINIASPDISIATAAIGDSWYVGIQSGGTFWLTRALGPNVGQQSITFTSVASWSTDTVHTIAVLGAALGRYVYVAYILNSEVYIRKWDEIAGLIISTTNLGSGFRASLAVDESAAWVFYLQHVDSRTLLAMATESEDWAPAVITSTTTATEEWDWPNSVRRIDDAQAALVAWSATLEVPNNIYVSSNDIEIPKSANELPLGTETINNRRGLTELETVLDAAGIKSAAADVVLYSELAAAQGTPKVTEPVTATDDAVKASEIIEAVLGSELFSLEPILDDQEEATATDDAAQKNQVTGAEAATASDTVRPNVQVSEVAAFADSVSQLIRVVAETATGEETLRNDRASADSGTAEDDVIFYITAVELPTATFLISRVIELLENPNGADVISGFNRPVSDSGQATDVAKWEYILREVAAANDISEQEARAVANTVRLLIQKSYIKLRTEGY